jgi:hypothetical protein
MISDVTILYQGGSGGFMLFYYLMLSGRYHAGIPADRSPSELISQQFNDDLVDDRTQWKSREVWPDNTWAKLNLPSPRLFLICNPFFAPDMHAVNRSIADGTIKLLLYTGLKIQTRMAWEKQAWWFTSVSREKLQTGSERDYLRWILGQGEYDPEVERIRQIYQPDLEIRLEDFVRHPCISGFPDPTQQQIEFVDRWMTLQSKKSQRLLNGST